jgi:adenosylcobinamide-phosphate synthase
MFSLGQLLFGLDLPGAPSLGVLAAALVIDRVLGEPPNALHPVVWMGKVIGACAHRAPRDRPALELTLGVVLALAVPAAFALACAALLAATSAWPLVYYPLSAVVLKSMFAFRGLGQAAFAVRDALRAGDLTAARGALRSLCSRDPSALDEPLLVAAAVESVAENSSDSVVAPLFYYALFGLPGAVFYRAVNTLDSMVGYHGRYEYFGKASARLDDVLNYVPARLTALALLLGGGACRCNLRRGLRILLRDGNKTESPNAGRPMAAMAGLLGVQLEKVGHYRLGDPGAVLGAQTIERAWRVASAAALLLAACVLLVAGGNRQW